MRHHFKVGDQVLGYNAKIERSDFYDVVAVAGDFVTLSRTYFSNRKDETGMFTVSGFCTLETGDPDKTLKRM